MSDCGSRLQPDTGLPSARQMNPSGKNFSNFRHLPFQGRHECAVDDLPCELLRRRKALFYHAAADLLYVSYRLLSLGPLAKGAVIGMF